MATTKKKASKSKWSFNINRKWALPIAFIGVFIIGGGIYLAKSNAASIAIQTVVQDPNTAGVAHTTGHLVHGPFQGEVANTSSWVVGSGDVNGHFMWYGPYDSAKIKNGISGCWRYASIKGYLNPYPNSAYIDIRATNSAGKVITTFSKNINLTESIATLSGPTTSKFCSPTYFLTAGNYYNIEVRMKPTRVSGDINLIRTNYSIY